MNKKRRIELNRALGLIDSAKVIIDRALSEEESALDNMPESFESTDRYIESEEAIEAMSEVMENLENASDRIGDVLI